MSVYILHAEGTDRYKIGHAKNLTKRIRSLQTGCPFPLVVRKEISGGEEFERFLHEAFSKYRVNGEWFEFTEDEFRTIDALSPDDFYRVRAAWTLLRYETAFVENCTRPWIDQQILKVRQILDEMGLVFGAFAPNLSRINR